VEPVQVLECKEASFTALSGHPTRPSPWHRYGPRRDRAQHGYGARSQLAHDPPSDDPLSDTHVLFRPVEQVAFLPRFPRRARGIGDQGQAAGALTVPSYPRGCHCVRCVPR
jgi:hypothetical protein